MRAVAQTAEPRLTRFTPQGLTTVLWAVVTSEAVGGRIYQRFTHARVTATSPDNGESGFIADVGGADAPVTLRTTYGDIRGWL